MSIDFAQPEIDFSVDQGRALRDEGMARAEAADQDGHDKMWIDAEIQAWCETGSTFSANDLRCTLANVRQPLIGARIRSWAKRGLIVHVGYTPSNLPSTHAHDIKLWRSA